MQRIGNQGSAELLAGLCSAPFDLSAWDRHMLEAEGDFWLSVRDIKTALVFHRASHAC